METWAGVLIAFLASAASVAAWFVNRSRQKQEDLDEIDSERQETDDPSIGSMRRRRWWLRKRKS